MRYVTGSVHGEVIFRAGLRMGEQFIAAGADRHVFSNRAGDYMVSLEKGEYQVIENSVLRWRILVPDLHGTYAVASLIVEIYPGVQGPPRGRSTVGEYVARGGDTMTGALILHADPDSESNGRQAATRDYVDGMVGSYVHTQTTPATEWMIAHNMGRHPVVMVTDLDGEVLDPAIVFDSINQIRVHCNAALAGFAYLN